MSTRAGSARGRRALVVLALTALVGGWIGCTRREPADAEHAGAAQDHAEGRVRLDPDAAARAGIRTASVAAARASTVVEGFGRALDPLPFVEAWHATAAARAAATVARAEYERVARLHQDDQNASTRDLQNARAALDKATVDLADATARLTLGFGAAAERGDAVADDLVAGRAALVRIDLPAGARLTTLPEALTVAEVAVPDRTHAARVLGRTPMVDPLVQGDGLLALVTEDPPRPGTALTTHVPSDAAAAGVAVPADAVVWVDARPAVYVAAADTGEEKTPTGADDATHADHATPPDADHATPAHADHSTPAHAGDAAPAGGAFERRPVTLGPRVGEGWIVTAGLAPGERVVVAGAARLLSSEIVGAEPAED